MEDTIVGRHDSRYMEHVLAIDLSTEPAQAVVVSVEGNKVTAVQRRTFSLGLELAPDQLLSRTLVPSSPETTQVDPNIQQPTEELDNKTVYLTEHTPLKSALAELTVEWTNSVVIAPMLEYLSLNIQLPFKDSKNINKIVDLEVQDIVPFEIDEFVVEGHAVHSISDNQHDVHVSLTPRNYIRNVLTLCRHAGLEPSIITTPCGALATLPKAAPDYFKDSYALISIDASGMYLCVSVDGALRADNSFMQTSSGQGGGSGPQSIAHQTSQIKLALLGFESKYSKKFAPVYIHGSRAIFSELQKTLGRPLESLQLADFVTHNLEGGISEDTARATLAALCTTYGPSEYPLTNFRVREFAFRPNWGALAHALASLKYYGLGLVALFLVTVYGVYQFRQLQIARTRNAIRDTIRSVIPDLNAAEGNEIPSFIGHMGKLSKDLESLGSSHEISPTNILVELTKDFAEQKDVTINEIDIRPDRVLLDISVPDYAAADRVERILKRKKDLYRRIRKDASSYASASGGRNFNFELRLVD